MELNFRNPAQYKYKHSVTASIQLRFAILEVHFGVSVEAVSYTHLDVYKRQVYTSQTHIYILLLDIKFQK